MESIYVSESFRENEKRKANGKILDKYLSEQSAEANAASLSKIGQNHVANETQSVGRPYLNIWCTE